MQEHIFISLALQDFKELLKESLRQELQFIKTATPREEKLLTREEAAKHLNITLPTLHAYTKEGLIPAHRLGCRVLYKQSELEQSLKKIRVYKGREL